VQRERSESYDTIVGDADALDRYKDAADRAAFQIKVGSDGFPPDLETLVREWMSAARRCGSLRRIPN